LGRAFGRQLLESIAPAGAGPALVQQDPDEPGREGRAAGELVEGLVRAHPGFLRELPGPGVVAQGRPGDPVDALVVPAHEDLEKLGLSGADPPYDLVVGQARPRGGIGHGLDSRHKTKGAPEAQKVTRAVTFPGRATLWA